MLARMMDTILNLGMNDEVVDEIVLHTKSPRFALDTYRRFLQMYGTVVLGIEDSRYENVIQKVKNENNYKSDLDLRASDLKRIVEEFKDIAAVPYEPAAQLKAAIEAVFDSWFSPRFLCINFKNSR